jgi:hypothetical protein
MEAIVVILTTLALILGLGDDSVRPPVMPRR